MLGVPSTLHPVNIVIVARWLVQGHIVPGAVDVFQLSADLPLVDASNGEPDGGNVVELDHAPHGGVIDDSHPSVPYDDNFIEYDASNLSEY